MNIIKRAKNIVLTPKNEWSEILEEEYSWSKLLTSYLLPLALIPAIGSFIGYGIIGQSVLGIQVGGDIGWGIRQALISLIATFGGVCLTALVINLLAEQFSSVKNFDKAFALVAYSYTPMCLAGIFYVFPALSVLALIAGLYGLYILYTGLQPMMQSPTEKTSVYFIVSLVCVIVVSAILSAVLGALFTRSLLSVSM